MKPLITQLTQSLPRDPFSPTQILKKQNKQKIFSLTDSDLDQLKKNIPTEELKQARVLIKSNILNYRKLSVV